MRLKMEAGPREGRGESAEEERRKINNQKHGDKFRVGTGGVYMCEMVYLRTAFHLK